MKLLIVGAGGREHALAWRLRHEEPSVELIAAPGNPGIAELARCVPIAPSDLDRLAALARDEDVDLTVVGPEAPLAAGIVDAFRAKSLPIFGPSRAAAMIETSKAFAKELMREAGVPTASAEICSSVASAMNAVERIGAPVVVKASGLAAGKGVMVCSTIDEAWMAITSMMEGNVFGEAGHTILVEEFMAGEELSVFFVTDGVTALPLVPAQDHKRLLDGDRGPNTGGMGAYAPVGLLDDFPHLIEDVTSRIATPTLEALRERGEPFTGLLYAGLMITTEGPKVVEFNCRFGDPETQAVLPVLDDRVSLLDLMMRVAQRSPLPATTTIDGQQYAATTVVAAAGYPDKPRTGDRIDLPEIPDNVLVFHAGTRRDETGALVTSGGRVLSVTGLGASLDEARRRSLEYAARVGLADKQYRTDIGWRDLARTSLS